MTRFAARRQAKPDIYMVGFDETNLPENWARLQSLQPEAKLVQGITGIYAAYRVCAQQTKSPLFFVVDADNRVYDDFDFVPPQLPAPNELMVWWARNPINDLTYGHGGIKLFPTDIFRQPLTATGVDISTSIATRTRTITQVASGHCFNTSPAKAWSTAFRECAKMAQEMAIGRLKNDAQRVLETWCTTMNDAPFASFCVAGAKAGRAFGQGFATDPAALARINDYAWMQEQFDAWRAADGIPAV